ncbi:MAG: dihydrofolate reductase [Salinirussus sp.]
MEVALVAAVAENGVIGVDGEMPWHYPADLRQFRERTTGHPVIVGRRTFERIVDRIGGPLPDRTNVVLSRSDPDVPGDAIVVTGVEAALDAARATGTDTAYVIGGAAVYEQFLPIADRLVLTRIPGTYDGDTVWPGHDEHRWTETDRQELGDGLAVHVYEPTV